MERSAALPTHVEYERERCEAALVQAAQVDPAAFGELYERYLERVFRYLRVRTESEEDAADLTQQVFLRVLDALPRYRDRGAPFAAWLFRIARNVATDYHRRRRSTVALDMVPEVHHPGDGADPEGAALRDEALTRLRILIRNLDPGKRELLALRFAAGLTAREIAPVVGKSEQAVKKQFARLLQTLKEQYHEPQDA